MRSFLPLKKKKVDIFDCKVFHLGGTGLLKLLDGQVSVDLLKEAKERGCITTWDLISATEETIAIVKYFHILIILCQVLRKQALCVAVYLNLRM